MNKEKEEKDKTQKQIDTQQVAVPRQSMRKIKIYAASNYMSITKTIELAIEGLCGDIVVSAGNAQQAKTKVEGEG